MDDRSPPGRWSQCVNCTAPYSQRLDGFGCSNCGCSQPFAKGKGLLSVTGYSAAAAGNDDSNKDDSNDRSDDGGGDDRKQSSDGGFTSPSLSASSTTAPSMGGLFAVVDKASQRDRRRLFGLPARLLSRTGYSYDVRMLKHKEKQKFGGGRFPPEHPERPNRVRAMWQHVTHLGLLDDAHHLPPRFATREELRLVHSEAHCAVVDALSSVPEGVHFGGDTYACADSSAAARLSCAGVIDAAVAVLSGTVANAVAMVRPPGHHAEESQVCGFCLYNNVAVAAQALLDRKLAKRVLVVDWDVHHGNGIQNIFYESSEVLYVSLHRYGHGFFPGTGHVLEAGMGAGLGYNINVAWRKAGMGDAEYLEAFKRVIMPVARHFDPQVVLVSSGFDAARGDPLGGNDITPHCYGQMTTLLRELAGGRVVVALEGGYNLRSICRSMENCVRALRLPMDLARRVYAVGSSGPGSGSGSGDDDNDEAWCSPAALRDIAAVLSTHAPLWPKGVLQIPTFDDGSPLVRAGRMDQYADPCAVLVGFSNDADLRELRRESATKRSKLCSRR
jgi:acetoin utilization deacetylase AcuC-like enzyme